MEADCKDPTDYGLTSFSRGGSKKERTVAKRPVHPLRRNMASWGALERYLRMFDTRDEPSDLGAGMRESDVPTLRDRLTELAEALNGKPPTKAALTLWVTVLKEHPIERICDAISQWAREQTRFPAPAQIAKICAARLSDRIESDSAKDKAQFADGAIRVLADPKIARTHLSRCMAILKPGELRARDMSMYPHQDKDGHWVTPADDAELAAERYAIAHQDDPV